VSGGCGGSIPELAHKKSRVILPLRNLLAGFLLNAPHDRHPELLDEMGRELSRSSGPFVESTPGSAVFSCDLYFGANRLTGTSQANSSSAGMTAQLRKARLYPNLCLKPTMNRPEHASGETNVAVHSNRLSKVVLWPSDQVHEEILLVFALVARFAFL
jgi:hypothetical protein